MNTSIALEIDSRGVARVTLNRPDMHNAFDDHMIKELTDCFAALGDNARVRLVILTGAGKSFSAGADLNWMKRAAAQGEEANRADAERLAVMLQILNGCPKPVVGLINGPAYGGGVGLAACCDIAVAASTAVFGLTEVRLGIIPAAISPFVLAKIGQSAARRWMLTGARFGADEALRIGLVHQVVDDLNRAAEVLIADILASGPQAIGDMKALVSEVAGRTIDTQLLTLVAHRIAVRRASDEGKEGIAAFIEKRKPAWYGQ